jgi:Helix-turn-helix of DDE superfamily endonuclease
MHVSSTMRWEVVRNWKEPSFKRLVGVPPDLFRKMAEYLAKRRMVSGHKVDGAKRGPKPRLCVEDELLMMLMYYREYRSFLHISSTYALSEMQTRRIIARTEEELIRSKLFALPGKKKLVERGTNIEMVLVDVSEHAIERPKKNSGATIQARRSGTP